MRTQRRQGRSRWRPLSLTLFLVAACSPLLAHDFSLTDTRLRIENDRFVVDMTCDLDALLLGLGSGHDAETVAEKMANLSASERKQREESLETLFQRRVRVRFDGQLADFEVAFPQQGETGASVSGAPSLGILARLSGRVPAEAQTVTFFASRSFRAIRLTFGAAESLETLLEPGEESEPVPVDEIAGSRPLTGSSPFRVGLDYLGLGFEHIVPLGFDHILFVLALFLLNAQLTPLLWQVTSFTVAHTLTLALSVLGWIAVPGSVVEPLIAVSIILVAVENMLTDELRPRRVAVVFLFGLLHGLGFGGVLSELGLPTGRLILGLLSFNVGVELGQLAVIAVAAALLGAFRSRPWYRSRLVTPLSATIALAGVVLLVTRLW